MRDPQIDELDGSESGFEAQVWVLLPALMQQFVDKHFAAYQLQVDEATKMLNKGRIKQQKYDRIIADATKPLLLMHGSGQPATARYTKDHLVTEDNGHMRLKDPSLGKFVLPSMGDGEIGKQLLQHASFFGGGSF